MKRAISELANLPDDRLFEEVAKGIPLIVQNAISLNEAAQCLHQDKQFRISEIMRGFAEEEAAKVPILIDLIRCPRIQERKMETARRFYGHVSKRIYATSCSYFRIASFNELCRLVERESCAYYLDGPNLVDWVFPNPITEERERALYVDYVQDITEASGDYFWKVPIVTPFSLWLPYETPDCVKLSQSLSEAGAKSPNGLSVIANLWRKFEPQPETDRKELQELIVETLKQLGKSKADIEDQPGLSFIVSHWSFPLWSLTLKEPRRETKDLEKLRKERVRAIERIEATDAKRDPPPAISRTKVEALDNAHAVWRKEVDARKASRTVSKKGSFCIQSSSELEKDFELLSYTRLEKMFCELTEEERASLLALGWYAREQVADWPETYERAINSMTAVGIGYQIGQAYYWLGGLNRWEAKPQPFSVGQSNRM